MRKTSRGPSARRGLDDQTMTEGNVAETARSRRRKKKKKKITWLEETTLEALVPAAGTTL